jgi:rSAM/selenodomain-associated transferase 2
VTVPVSVIIAALDEEERIGAAIDSARAAGAGEVIVVDGGSADRTALVARHRGASVLAVAPPRAHQFNRGAEVAKHESLIFLHADTTLPEGAAAAVAEALESAVFGGFRLRFAERTIGLLLGAALINLRTRITLCPWGDQAQFIRRAEFLEMGGFPPMPIMEDYELALRMRRRGPTVILPLTAVTSGRRFLRKGVLRTVFTNWRIIAAYRRGTSPQRLAEMYRV